MCKYIVSTEISKYLFVLVHFAFSVRFTSMFSFPFRFVDRLDCFQALHQNIHFFAYPIIIPKAPEVRIIWRKFCFKFLYFKNALRQFVFNNSCFLNFFIIRQHWQVDHRFLSEIM